MDQLTNALAFANCSLSNAKAYELVLDVGSARQLELALVETQYSDVLLGVSFFTVFGICLCSLYAFYRSHIFHLHVRAEISQLAVTTRERKSLPPSQGTLMGHAMDKSPTAGPCTISFAYLSYFVQETSRKGAPEKQIMHDASGTFHPGRLTAIMGPSGSGKTTLLNLVSGRVFSGSYHGYRMLNHELTPPKDYDVFMSSQGYVEQTDTFIETMTVRESLLFSAYLRLPDSMTLREKISRVQTILHVVQLDDAANTVIGGLISGIKGLSGGQKRRLSIATELLRLPSVLILDEPTSGLDSTSSLLLVQMLASLAIQQGLTVVSTIHQPRAEIYDLFHDVVLMDRGGFLIYCGPSLEAKTHLAAVGNLAIKPEDYINPADFIIDALGLDPEKEWTKSASMVQVATSDSSPFLDHWKQSKYFAALMQAVARYTDVPVGRVYKVPKQSWLHVQTWTCFERRYSRLYGKKVDLVFKIGQIVAVAIVITTAFSYTPLSELTNDPRLTPTDKQIIRHYGLLYQNVMLLFTISAYGLVTEYLNNVPEYFVERPLLLLERKSNAISYYPYVYAAFLIETFEGVVNSIVLMTVALVLHNWNGLSARSILSLYLIFILSTLAWQSIVCFACSVSHRTPVVYSVLFMVLGVGFLFSGVCVGYNDMSPIWYWSYFGMAPALMARSLIVASTSSELQVQMLVSSSMLNMSLDAMFDVLVASIVGFRLLAIATFYGREYFAKQIKFKSVDWIEARLRSFV
ncbi:hypothetical protein H310_10309 [Aphanomyces invadans]|uniref:ABC transporter domain-containing protein n=1 Tax=Aphanomyces invadans TaxID=157072 RepID=A0A024TRH5_9STRA|nr:hypothetical protein H310_10309 [Aphanomyces invadans]ETV96609.1 hypothetical protein H310_10309 [Aphanomyces invadans]|eukprot:XP_008874872.1 hypothetical protein H310_10309 [Aphanomyces invadans]